MGEKLLSALCVLAAEFAVIHMEAEACYHVGDGDGGENAVDAKGVVTDHG